MGSLHGRFAELAEPLGADVHVIVSAGSGTHLSRDWWVLAIRELDVVVCEYGLEAAEHALAEAVAVETRRRIDTGDLSPSECRLVVRLWLASRSGVLAELLRRAQVVEFDLAGVPEPERAAGEEFLAADAKHGDS